MERPKLVHALKVVMPGVDKEGKLLEGADTFVFDNTWIKTFNDHLSVSFPLDTGMECAVRAEEFYGVIAKMSGAEIVLSTDGEKIIAKDTITTLTMAVLKSRVTGYIDNMNLADLEWKDLPEDFIDGIRRCIFSAATNPMYGPLTGLSINGEDILSSDNYRASWYQMKGEMESFLLPVGAAKELSKINSVKRYALGESWVHFMDENGVTFSSRLMLGEFPGADIKELFDGVDENKYQFPEALLESLSRADVLAYSEEIEAYPAYVTLYEEKGKLICKGERVYGFIEDKIPVTKGTYPKGVRLDVSPKFLKSILSATRDFQLKNNNLMVFTNPSFKHLISTVTKE